MRDRRRKRENWGLDCELESGLEAGIVGRGYGNCRLLAGMTERVRKMIQGMGKRGSNRKMINLNGCDAFSRLI